MALTLLLALSVAIRAEEPRDGVRADLESLVDHIEQLQITPGGIPELNRRLDVEIDRIEMELVRLDQELESARSTLHRFSQSSGESELDHWAYLPPISPPIPQTRFADRVRNPIDSFVFKKLGEENLTPSPETPKENLIRRVYFDLIGLPPTVSELDAFLGDDSPDAYEKLVDQLLASPHYGERRAQFWLDLARCADSCGYHIDANRPMWPYREWVIEAFNRDLPFDQFTIEQIAGDLLPNPSEDQRIATGFHRNTMFNEEGGIDPEEFRVKAVVDRVGTTGTVWMGTTLACAECHDHKYDPVSQKEFFELYAFYNTTSELGGGTFASRAPMIQLFEENQEQSVEDLSSKIEDLQKKLDTHTPELVRDQAKWEERMKADVDWKPIEVESAESAGGASLERRRDDSWVATGIAPVTDIYRIGGVWKSEEPTALRLEILNNPIAEGSNPVGRHAEGQPALSAIRLLTGPADGAGEVTETNLLFPTWNTPDQLTRRVVDSNPRSGWIFDETDTETYEAWFEIPKTALYPGGTRFTIELDQRAGLESTLGRFRLTATDHEKPVRFPPEEIQEILDLKRGYPNDGPGTRGEIELAALAVADPENKKRTFEQEQALAKYFRSIAPSLEPTRNELEKTTREREELLKKVPQALIMGEVEKLRETRVHVRGDFLRPGEEVEPNVPSIFGDFPSELPRNRLGLAKWLVGPDNPLVARVTVNRIWQEVFGRGIVETSDDFGVRGIPPTHPELLDWLAVEFVNRGWSVKEILRLIVTSSTYRQSTNVSEEILKKDPYNRLLARGPRFRMSAETIRDNALAVSGLLNRTLGGPSVFPHQPEGIWSQIGSPGYGVDEWIPDEDADRFRRGIYTYWRRSNPYPSFIAFDAPTREYCTVQRPITNTPLQALVTLNDPVYLEAASGFAARLMREKPGADAGEILDHAFRLCLSRSPSDYEMERLLALQRKQVERFSGDLSSIEESFSQLELETPPTPELASWAIVCQVLLNLDETLTKG